MYVYPTVCTLLSFYLCTAFSKFLQHPVARVRTVPSNQIAEGFEFCYLIGSSSWCCCNRKLEIAVTHACTCVHVLCLHLMVVLPSLVPRLSPMSLGTRLQSALFSLPKLCSTMYMYLHTQSQWLASTRVTSLKLVLICIYMYIVHKE